MTGNELRKSFVDFFESKKHKHFESASLIPDDKTLLLTVAGMVPFKPFFLGEKKAPYKRITTYQKCIRTNDLENVGVTPRHHTFFEMLGNFSFGDYFKKEAISWSWEYITEHLKLDKDRLWISVHHTDDEAYDIWTKEVGISPERMVRLGDEDNWWAAGPVGSCGPCSEIYYDTQNMGENNEEINAKPGDEGDRFLEIWNLVFTEWNRLEDGSLVPLPEKNIDTGAGIERVASVVQGKSNNFETDIFALIIKDIKKILELKDNEQDTSVKIIADHMRACTFLICDGVIPSNDGRGYILKKLIRRAYGTGSIANKKIFNSGESFLYKLVNSVVETMKQAYPELVEKQKYIEEIIKDEEEKFAKTLKSGTELLLSEIEKIKDKKIPSEITFKLYDTFGFPFELTKLVCESKGKIADEKEFNLKLDEQVERSKGARVVLSDMIKDEFIDKFYKEHGETKFTGYETLEDTATILSVEETKNGLQIILDKTPFYSAQGGQVSDKGIMFNDDFSSEVVDMAKKSDIFMHYIKINSGNVPKLGDKVNLKVDKVFRAGTMRNHTATHILHKAIKEVLGDHVNQAGSLVYDKGLRFDFTYNKKLDEKTIRTIERRVNEIIQNNNRVEVTYTTQEKADEMGVIALFGEKYKDTVRVVDIVDYSAELCGGTHCPHTGLIGSFYILSEESKASSVRRIEAITGVAAYEHSVKNMKTIYDLSQELKVEENNLLSGVQKQKETIKDLENEIESLKQKLIDSELDDILKDYEEYNGIKILVKELKLESSNLKIILDKAKEKLDNAVILFAAKSGDNLVFVSGVTNELTKKYKAGEIVKFASNIAGGNGGGRPDFAQAGAKDITKLGESLNKTLEFIKGK
ncbi:alanine--tRNA ligase [Oceanivirga salmonicida]|uniref:alanine--tRNA ligase n=1 Tax=Oceanivirga salmonicida TaxID=1769291 RepID=UPI0012E179BC|nr:alanine--tRNA ligase [Oceanivirga salmonicida]